MRELNERRERAVEKTARFIQSLAKHGYVPVWKARQGLDWLALRLEDLERDDLNEQVSAVYMSL